MSCAQVMYQPYSSPYLAYDRSASAPPSSDDEKKYKLGHDHASAGSATSTPDPYGPRAPDGSTSTPGPSPTSAQQTSRPSCASGGSKEETDADHKEAQYLSANCVVFTHYSGDVSSVVDEHFSRALSHSYATDSKPGLSKGAPLSQRNFPPSFWNSSYQPSKPTPLGYHAAASSHHADLYGAAESYHHMSAATSLHHPLAGHPGQPDPWHHYPAYAPHRPVADLPAYPAVSSVASSSRFNPQSYSSFLLQPPAAPRLPTMAHASQCAAVKAEGWAASRYHHDPLATAADLSHTLDSASYAAAHPYTNMAGLETSVQEPTKDLYWF